LQFHQHLADLSPGDDHFVHIHHAIERKPDNMIVAV
jgi:hypothetical protein